MNEFLQEHAFLKDRIDAGIDVHPSDAELDEFVSLAKAINPALEWAPKGCQECVNSLIKFVYNNQTTVVKRETFPKANAGKKDDKAEE